jgi:hypothetical protein
VLASLAFLGAIDCGSQAEKRSGDTLPSADSVGGWGAFTDEPPTDSRDPRLLTHRIDRDGPVVICLWLRLPDEPGDRPAPTANATCGYEMLTGRHAALVSILTYPGTERMHVAGFARSDVRSVSSIGAPDDPDAPPAEPSTGSVHDGAYHLTVSSAFSFDRVRVTFADGSTRECAVTAGPGFSC